MENRAFNYISIVTFFLLVCYLAYDNLICRSVMTWVLLFLIGVLAVCYYYSRFKKQYETSIIISAVCSYGALMLNYFVNSGILGPTLIIFITTLSFLIALTKPKQLLFWFSLHIIVGVSLLIIEYLHPELVPDTYPDRKSRFIDMGSTYVTSLIFIFAVVNYIRNYFNHSRLQSEQRAKALLEQNTQIIKQNELLEQVNNEKNKLFSIVSHDLKTPLDSIHGYLEILAKSGLSADEKSEIEGELLEQTKYTSDLLMNLLSWAKAQMQGITVNRTHIDLKQMIVSTTTHKLSSAARKGIKITNSIREPIEVVADNDMLSIVLRNLLNNAIKFTKPGGEIVIRAIKNVGEAVISVSDTGIGIPLEKQHDIFSLHTQSTYGTNNEKGIGLGLRMCKEFMDYQHGRIWFESVPGKGSVFYISLPLTRA